MKKIVHQFTVKQLVVLVAACGLLAVTGCTSTEVGEAAGEAVEGAEAVAEGVAESVEGAAKDGKEDMAKKPKGGNQVVGEVNKVEQEFNYIILKATGKIPADSVLDIYRGKKKVGSVKVSPPRDGNFVSADILDGKLKEGDVAKLQN